MRVAAGSWGHDAAEGVSEGFWLSEVRQEAKRGLTIYYINSKIKLIE